MGVLESLGKGFTVAGLGDAIALLVLFLILFFRPVGILGVGETGSEGL
jgi:branched-subunit amino acid ABC-type transport system permease component